MLCADLLHVCLGAALRNDLGDGVWACRYIAALDFLYRFEDARIAGHVEAEFLCLVYDETAYEVDLCSPAF